MRKIEVKVAGKVMGFAYDNETDDNAASRLVLEAERFGNEGKARIHLSCEGDSDGDESILDGDANHNPFDLPASLLLNSKVSGK